MSSSLTLAVATMLEAHLVTAALHPQQVTARGIGLIVRAADGALAIVALALLGSALGQRCQRRELGKAERRGEGVMCQARQVRRIRRTDQNRK